MEQQSKDSRYYIPDREDIRHGDEYEYLNINGDEDVWEKAIWPNPCYHEQSGWVEYNVHRHLVDIRVPYLTKEQIEELGWEKVEETDMRIVYNKGVWELNTWKDDTWKYISLYTDEVDYRYEGECKSINELRYLMKLLKIQ